MHRTSVVAAIAVIAVPGWAWLAGNILLAGLSLPVDDATPLTLYRYWFHHGSEPSVQRWLGISMLGSLAVLSLPLWLMLVPKKRSLHGDARFATGREIARAGLFAEKGIVVGKFKSRFLVYGGSQHVLMSAPTRSGKGVGIVIPNLLTWPDSVVVLDVKQENHAITSKYRQQHGQACYLFNPAAADRRTHRYNPLSYISSDPSFRVDDVQKIAGMLFPDQPGTDAIWTATPRTLFLGVVLYLLETPAKPVTLGQALRETLTDGDGSRYFAGVIRTRNLASLARQASEPDARKKAKADLDTIAKDRGNAVDRNPLLDEMAIWAHLSKAYRQEIGKSTHIASLVLNTPFDRTSADAGHPLSQTCVQALNAYVSISSDNTRAGVMTSFRSRLELWNNPIVDAATSANDFDLRDVRRKLMSVYLGVTPDNLERMSPLLNLFFQQLIDLNTRELPEANPTLKYQCLVLPDEFTAMGKIGALAKGISYIAGYGLRMLPIIQSPAQLAEVYGKDAARTFATNHALQIVFPPKASELQTARDVSEWLGYQTVKGLSHSRSKNVFSKREKSESASDQRRALMLPQEITSLGRESELVIVEDCPPIMARKIRYYRDRTFVDRLKNISPSLAALGRRMPNEEQLRNATLTGELAAEVPTIQIGLEVDPFKAGIAPVRFVNNAGRTGNAVRQPVFPRPGFVVDFSSVETPRKGTVDAAALHAYADSLCRQAGINV